MEDSVTQIIEQNMTGLDHLLYMSAQSDSSGNVSVTLTFMPGTDPDIAQVQVQNKLQQATTQLPQIVQQQGIRYWFSHFATTRGASAAARPP